MCKNNTIVTNPYTGRFVLAPCRKCDDCLTQKSSRYTQRIRNFMRYQSYGKIPYFITLSYNNKSVPWINKDVRNKDYFEVYRGFSLDTLEIIGNMCNCKSTDKPIEDILLQSNTYRHPYAKHITSILYYPDIQKFFKRLRINFKRKYGLKDKIFYFVCGEYGNHKSNHFRPHWHLLLYIDKKILPSSVKSSVMSCWSFCDYNKIDDSWFEVAFDVSKYVAGYVTKLNQVPSYLRHKKFAPKVHFSNNFGVLFRNTPALGRDLLLDCISKSNFTFDFEYYSRQQRVTYNIPIPQYILSRYFPKFQGQYKFTYQSIFDFISNIDNESICVPFGNSLIDGNLKFRTFRNNVISSAKFFNLSLHNYAFLYIKFLQSYHRFQMKEHIRSPTYIMSLRHDVPINYNDNKFVNTLHSYLSRKLFEFEFKQNLNTKVYG